MSNAPKIPLRPLSRCPEPPRFTGVFNAAYAEYNRIGCCFQVMMKNGRVGFAVNGSHTGHRLKEYDPQGVQVCPEPDGFTAYLFRGHEGGRSDTVETLGDGQVFRDTRETKISKFACAVVAYQNISRTSACAV